MAIKELEEKLAKLKQARKKLDEEISSLEKEIKEQKSKKILNLSVDKNNPKLFQYYLVEVKKLKAGTFRDYCGALKNMKEMLEDTYGLAFNCSFVEIDDPIAFHKLIAKFEDAADLVAENRRRHHDISAAYNNYYSFLLAKRGWYEYFRSIWYPSIN